jgi:hypothetical protein
MSVVNSAYTSAGLKGVVEVYDLFPDRLRPAIITKHAEVFRQLWRELTTSERSAVEEYTLAGDIGAPATDLESVYYEAKLRDLDENYTQRRNARLQEVSTLEPEVATALVLDFEKANMALTQITRDLLAQARHRESEVLRREQEALLFEPSEHSGLCTVQF